jgi:hypothetical protein
MKQLIIEEGTKRTKMTTKSRKRMSLNKCERAERSLPSDVVILKLGKNKI